MTESELRGMMVAQMREWLGAAEGDARHKLIVDTYNSIKPMPVGYKLAYTDSWCAATVSAAAWRLNLTDIVFPECSCPRMVELYRQAGRWVEDDGYIPKPGDLIFYGWSDSGKGDYWGQPDHVGLVEKCDGKTITVIEGNRNDQVQRRTILVNARYIRGFGTPNYAAKADKEPDKLTGFPDVPAGAWYEEYVLQAAQKGILTGYPDGTFKPLQAVTRAELAAALHRIADYIERR